MTFGERLVFYRSRKNMSQKSLAESLGITPTALNYWEKDKREPSIATVKQLAEILDVSANILIGLEEEEIKKSPAPEGAEDEIVKMVVAGLTDLLVKAGWIAPGGDLTDAQFRTLASYVIGLSAYFNSESEG